MQVLHARCAGLDVHKDIIVACRRVVHGNSARKQLESFGSTTRELLRLTAWLEEVGVTHVVMESTGVFWRPVWNVLDGHFEQILANPSHVRAVPGRKSDVKDAEWLSELLAHGLVEASFIPDAATFAVRELTRAHKQLTRDRARQVQRIQKRLQSCNIRLDSVLADILGKTGRRILDAICAGESDPHKLAALAANNIKATRAQLAEALEGRVNAVTRILIRTALNLIDAFDENMRRLEQEIDEAITPFAEAVELLKTIPGVSDGHAHTIIGEIGVDMSRFPTPGHLVSWAGMCPRLDQSAGKRRSNKLRDGNKWLKTALCQAALSSRKCKAQSYLHARFWRIRARRGAKKATMAVASSILIAVHAMLTAHQSYRDLGPDFYTRKNNEHTVRRLTRRLIDLGYDVELRRAA